jgi:hypothetical protein
VIDPLDRARAVYGRVRADHDRDRRHKARYVAELDRLCLDGDQTVDDQVQRLDWDRFLGGAR